MKCQKTLEGIVGYVQVKYKDLLQSSHIKESKGVKRFEDLFADEEKN